MLPFPRSAAIAVPRRIGGVICFRLDDGRAHAVDKECDPDQAVRDIFSKEIAEMRGSELGGLLAALLFTSLLLRAGRGLLDNVGHWR